MMIATYAKLDAANSETHLKNLRTEIEFARSWQDRLYGNRNPLD